MISKAKNKKFKVGDKVFDKWWPWKIGKITKVLKTRMHVLFFSPSWLEIYDKAHYKYLKKI